MRLPSHIGFLVLYSIATTVSVMAQPSTGKGIYTCTDAAGKRLTADRPIAQCSDREQRILGPTGVERSRVGPALTEIEMAQRLESRRQEQLLQQSAHEQRRRDAVLVARYPERSSHDSARRSALVQTEELKNLAQQHLLALDQEHQRLQQELAFYAKDASKAPVRLRGAVQDVEKAQRDQHALLSKHTQAAQRTHQRFDAELERLQPLWASQN